MKSFNSKVLLFGEHTVVNNHRGLAIPFNQLSGNWAFKNDYLDRNLILFADYIDHHNHLFKWIDVDSFFADLDQGLYFESNIPIGKGLGSSGALVAATFDRYKTDIAGQDLQETLAGFKALEAFFHGNSSGFDPLVSYYNQPVLIAHHKINLLDKLDIGSEEFDLCIIDTRVTRSTQPLVEAFQNFISLPENDALIINNYIAHVDLAIDALCSADTLKLTSAFEAISGFQYAYLDFLIDDGSKALWKEGLASDFFKIKICGAGGGGFLLCLTSDLNQLKKQYPARTIFNLTK